MISYKTFGQGLKEDHIKYTGFTVTAKLDKATVAWSTDNSFTTNYFEVQKSSDGINYKTIALVLGPDPKQPGCDCYGCFEKLTHKNFKPAWYRLKHIDINGKIALAP